MITTQSHFSNKKSKQTLNWFWTWTLMMINQMNKIDNLIIKYILLMTLSVVDNFDDEFCDDILLHWKMDVSSALH